LKKNREKNVFNLLQIEKYPDRLGRNTFKTNCKQQPSECVFPQKDYLRHFSAVSLFEIYFYLLKL
jgi:hypothetical protein